MTRTKLDTPAFADQSVDTRTILDGTIQNQDISGSLTNAKLANSSLSINGTSVSLGGSISPNIYLDWQAVVVADGSTTLNAVAGRGYFLDTNTGVIEVFLPSSPSRGDTIALVDYGGTFATNRAIINTGGQLIDSTTGPDFKLTTNNTIAELVYVDANKGWQVILNQAAGTTPDAVLTTSGIYGNTGNFIEATGGTITTTGDFKVHTFTGDGCFVVSNAGSAAGSNKVDYLVVAGGGSGGGVASPSSAVVASGGGGAGGHRTSFPSPNCNAGEIPVGIQTYPITVGAGGAGGSGPTTPTNAGNPGSNSIFATITSAGGGKGGKYGNPTGESGSAGGSGGGGGYSQGGAATPGGAGNTPPVSPPQGNNGGTGMAAGGGSSERGSGGGGGAGGAGQNSPNSTTAGDGGNGVANSITGSSVTRAGGGGGGVEDGTGAGAGGPGGGGDGGDRGAVPAGHATSGTANTGGGGGGGANGTSSGPDAQNRVFGSGGKGIVIIRYKFQ